MSKNRKGVDKARNIKQKNDGWPSFLNSHITHFLNQTPLLIFSQESNQLTFHSTKPNPSLTTTPKSQKTMTDILISMSQIPSNSSTVSPISNDGFHQQSFPNHGPLITTCAVDLYSTSFGSRQEAGDQDSVLGVVLTLVRNSFVGCKNTSSEEEEEEEEEKLMDIGWPTNVRHIAHVTFDRFNGFLGLPVEFEPEVSRRPPSASTRVFGVSTESMQLSFDPRGNCVPTILLMMQRRLYLQGGLESEGIFRINPENGQEEYVREQLNNGVIPENIDVHCLAGLIKAWFRELPRGILDSLSPERVMEAQSEEECSQLVSLLPPTEAALLDWAVNLMADVAQFEIFNKMNARNIAMVFAPNMTQMSDPLTALMYAVRVMNFLKTLVEKTLRQREECLVESGPTLQLEPTDEDGHHTKRAKDIEDDEASVQDHEAEEPEHESRTENNAHGFLASIENIISDGKREKDDNSPLDATVKDIIEGGDTTNVGIKRTQSRSIRIKNTKKGSKKHGAPTDEIAEKKKKDLSVLSRVNLHAENEAWR